MPNYQRDKMKGGTYFITVVLQDRRCDFLVRYIDEFRAAFRETLSHYPFETIAITVLPDHFHLVLKLPEHQDNYSRIIQVLKANFTKISPNGCLKIAVSLTAANNAKAKQVFGNADFGNTAFVMKTIWRNIFFTLITIP